MKSLHKYVGKVVRLNDETFRARIRQSRQDGAPPENRFLVATVSREMNKLICYGSGLCIEVGTTDVVLI